MKRLAFGVEVEMKNISRESAAKLCADFFHTRSYYAGGHLGAYAVKDSSDRVWKFVSDASLHSLGCEFVTPVCNYEDIETIQELIRSFRHNGAKIDGECGIHVHVSLRRITSGHVINLVNLFYKFEDLIFKSCKVKSRRRSYCRNTSGSFVEALNIQQPSRKKEFEDIWYESYADYSYNRQAHYHTSRYHALNLHSWFHGNGTAEFRLFNSTLHAGRVKSYIQFCLAIVALARTLAPNSTDYHKVTVPANDTEYNVFDTFLKEVLGLNGDEFKTCRHHMLHRFKEDLENLQVTQL